jgi:hypothetical protein
MAEGYHDLGKLAAWALVVDKAWLIMGCVPAERENTWPNIAKAVKSLISVGSPIGSRMGQLVTPTSASTAKNICRTQTIVDAIRRMGRALQG